jgi:acetate kinase
VGAYYAVLGTVHALVFTAGIGENDGRTRAEICEGLEHMGIAVDPEKNFARSTEARDISAPGAYVRTLVIPTNEELAIAEATMRALEKNS